MEEDIQWMDRALLLAEYGRGNVSPNPMVGCVIVANRRIIGEGWHRKYGESHAEVNAVIDADTRGNSDLLPESTVYVTLEPCSHTGKTPPCADLLVRRNVKRVVICNGDPNPLVSGRGIRRLRDAGILVEPGIQAARGLVLNKRFFINIKEGRPYVILKWAETADGFLGYAAGVPVQISGMLSNMRVHKWRTEEDAILIGYNTARMDNPQLNARNWTGRNPVRVILDRYLQLPETLHIFSNEQPSIVVNYSQGTPVPADPERYKHAAQTAYLKIARGNEIEQLLSSLHERKIHSVLVEGGAAVLSAFLESGLWDEIRRCQAVKILGRGIKAPMPAGIFRSSEQVESDLWTYYSKD